MIPSNKMCIRDSVAAEQRVDRVEARRVVAVVGGSREDRGEVEQGDTELREVIESLYDAIKIAPVELLRSPGHDVVDRITPLFWQRPFWRLAGVGRV